MSSRLMKCIYKYTATWDVGIVVSTSSCQAQQCNVTEAVDMKASDDYGSGAGMQWHLR